VEEGDLIVQGQTLGLIEAMKVFNEIESPLSGILLKFCVEEGKMVREGETLCLIKPQEGEAR
jgi:acetyl-CoA carboxylase biotin carboxyl carrier protein